MIDNVVLVHGAWVDGSSWNRVIPLLEARGMTTLAAQLSLRSLSEDVATTVRALERIGGPAILVGHSYGGAVISVAGAESPHAKALVFVAAYAPDAGQAVGALNETLPPMPMAAHIQVSGDALWIARQGFRDAFAHDLPATEADLLAVTQKPLAFAALGEPLRAAAWANLPSAYVVSEFDRVISPDAQRLFAAKLNARTSSVASGHLSPASNPDAIVEAIMSLR